MNIDGIAHSLGVSKASVSRALSGRAGVSEVMRGKIVAFAAENGYVPNAAARTLSSGRTSNIAFAVPNREEFAESSFFLSCMLGAEYAASESSYDLLCVPMEIDRVKRAVMDGKADGIILSRGVENCAIAAYLRNKCFPFVLVGSTGMSGVTQADHDHRAAARELTRTLLPEWRVRTALIIGRRDYTVNISRADGFSDADGGEIVWDSDGNVGEIFGRLYSAGVRGFFCGDDAICAKITRHIFARDIRGVKLASMYHSNVLSELMPQLPACRFDAQDLGAQAVKLLIRKLGGENVPIKTLLHYSLTNCT